MRRALAVLKRTGEKTLSDRVMDMAAAMSYYAVFSIFPLLIGAVVAASFFLDSEQVQSQIFSFVGSQLPMGEALVRETVQNVIQARGQAGLFALLSLLWSGSNIFSSIANSVNRIWEVKNGRGFLVEQAVRIAMLLGAGALFLAYVLATAGIRVLTDLPITLGGLSLFNNPLVSALVGLLPFGLMFIIFLLIYKLLPATNVPWRPALSGALLAAVLFEIAKYAFVFYVENFGHFNLVYGSLAGVIILFLWAYFSSVILFLGAEFASVLTEPLGAEAAAVKPDLQPASQLAGAQHSPAVGAPSPAASSIAQSLVSPRQKNESRRHTAVRVAASSALIAAAVAYFWSIIGKRGPGYTPMGQTDLEEDEQEQAKQKKEQEKRS